MKLAQFGEFKYFPWFFAKCMVFEQYVRSLICACVAVGLLLSLIIVNNGKREVLIYFMT